MDIANQSREDMKITSPRLTTSDILAKSEFTTVTNPKTTMKRSFDVAFLILPDEKLKNRQMEKHARLNGGDAIVTYPTQSQICVKSDERLRELISVNKLEHLNRQASLEMTNNNNESLKFMHSPGINGSGDHSPRMYDDPAIIRQAMPIGLRDVPKSAFTKVPHTRQESPIPAPPLSPEQLSCSSTSPPISISPPRNVIYHNFRQEYPFSNGSPFHAISQMQQQVAQSQKLKQQFMYRPMQGHPGNGATDVSQSPNSNSYIPTVGFPFGAANNPFAPQPDITGIVRNPAAAALLTTLIPPTLASSFTMTAQNVCAKCNISFRMTSDLVYHMRSHHKSEFTSDTNRRKREDKLKCPVCNESFRERHHLTRHMTAHQDKASDETDSHQLQRRQK